MNYPQLIHDLRDAPSDVHFVCDVLQMWGFVEGGYAAASTKDRGKIEAAAHPFSDQIRFTGFSGKKEAAHLNIARFLVDQIAPFTLFKGRTLDAGVSMINAYAKMLHVFLPMRDSLRPENGLSVDQIVAVLRARPIPVSMLKP